MDFKKATDILFDDLTHEDLAMTLDVSIAAIRQARLGKTAKAHRQPPPSWEKAIERLAKRRIRELSTLANSLK